MFSVKVLIRLRYLRIRLRMLIEIVVSSVLHQRELWFTLVGVSLAHLPASPLPQSPAFRSRSQRFPVGTTVDDNSTRASLSPGQRFESLEALTPRSARQMYYACQAAVLVSMTFSL